MSYQHRRLAAGRWNRLSLAEQMANVGSEVERAIGWKEKGNRDYSRMAFDRALELLDLSLASSRSWSVLKEVARVRELLIDWFLGNNIHKSTDELWRKYFFAFTLAAHSRI